MKQKRSINIKKNKIIIMTALLLILIFINGCTNTDRLNIKESVKSTKNFEETDIQLPVEDESFENSIIASNRMGLELIQEMVRDEEKSNLLLSPISLSFALAMVQNGAEGETQLGILTAMDEEEDGINERYNRLLNYLNALDKDDRSEIPGVKMKVANSLWIREELEPKADFVDILSGYYNAQVYRTDFSDKQTIKDMNLWVEEQTNHLLKETIKEIEPLVIAYLMNTVYFKGTWQNEFYEYATVPEAFYIWGGQTVTTDMMHKTENLPYYEDDLCQMTSLSYHGGSSMVIILPKGNVEEFLNMSDDTILEKVMGFNNMTFKRLALSLPKLDYEVSNNLNERLIKRGMDKAFSEEEADFKRMVEIPEENVYISNIFQNARIKLDEKGTEAAAVTVVEMTGTSAMPEEDPIIFQCNKPFIYLIKDDKSGAVLFIGVVREP